MALTRNVLLCARCLARRCPELDGVTFKEYLRGWICKSAVVSDDDDDELKGVLKDHHTYADRHRGSEATRGRPVRGA